MKKVKVMSVFTGAGGLEGGLNHDVFDVVGHSEINKSACQILHYHFPEIKNFGDITKIDSKLLPQFDMLVGGSPCQNLSMAGNKKGLAGSKSGLFYTFVNLLKENNPDYFIWENVKGTFYSSKGMDFFSVQKHFHDAGYHIQWQLLNSEDFGVAQVRNRVFVFGAKNKNDLPGLLKIVDSSKQKNTSVKFSHFCGSMMNNGFVQTITASYGALSGNGTKIIEGMDATKENLKKVISMTENKNVRLLTHIEGERLMSWKEDWTKFGMKEDGKVVEISDRERYRAIGNGIVSNCVKAIVKFFDKREKVFEENQSISDMSSYSILETINAKDVNDTKRMVEAHKEVLKSLKLRENIDYLSKGKKIYIINFRFIDALLGSESLKALITDLKHPTKGMLNLDKTYMKTEMNEVKSLKNETHLADFLEKNEINKKYLSKKECEYIYSKIK